jgi:hypothetical protein
MTLTIQSFGLMRGQGCVQCIIACAERSLLRIPHTKGPHALKSKHSQLQRPRQPFLLTLPSLTASFAPPSYVTKLRGRRHQIPRAWIFLNLYWDCSDRGPRDELAVPNNSNPWEAEILQSYRLACSMHGTCLSGGLPSGLSNYRNRSEAGELNRSSPTSTFGVFKTLGSAWQQSASTHTPEKQARGWREPWKKCQAMQRVLKTTNGHHSGITVRGATKRGKTCISIDAKAIEEKERESPDQ